MATDWTPEDHRVGRVLITSRSGVKTVARRLGFRYSIHEIQEHFAPEIKKVRDARKKERKVYLAVHQCSNPVYDPGWRVVVPDHVLAERERRQALTHRDLTGWLCGDPPVGCSALDGRV